MAVTHWRGTPKAEASRPVPPPKRGPLGKRVAAILAFSFWLLPGMLGNILFEWCVDVVVWPGDCKNIPPSCILCQFRLVLVRH